MDQFDLTTLPSRIVFGRGTLDRTAEEVRRLGRSRVLLLATPELAATGDRVAAVLGGLLAGRFDGAVVHTPVAVTEQALLELQRTGADCVVAVGGGSTTGLAKALAVRTGVDQVVLPTTYAGSEVTPVLGETEDGVKTTRSDPAVLPETVVYDVELSAGLPRAIAVTSAVNALAHAVEALYSAQANPVTDGMALDAVELLTGGLRALADGTDDLGVRSGLLRGAWLAGTCLGTVGMGLHHKLCHTLGGSFDLPHAPVHTVVLPHAMAYNAAAVPEVMDRIAARMGVADAPGAVHDLVRAAGGPTSLAAIGMPADGLDRAAELATAAPYPNPAPVTRDGIRALLDRAQRGDRPAAVPGLRGAVAGLTEQVTRSFDADRAPRATVLLRDLVRRLHGFAVDNDLTQQEWQTGIDFLTRAGHITTDTRQEFILLSDTLGLSSVIDLLTNSRTPDSTSSAVLGPFYVADPPELAQGTDISAGLPGVPLHADLTVTDTRGTPLAGAVVDVWQSDDDGFYDVQQPDLEGPVLRGRLRTDGDGRLRFRSILPSEYPIPTDGPVGGLLAATGRHPYRAPHLHVLIDAPGHRRLVTQLFVRGGRHLDSDAVFGVKDDLIVDFVPRTGPMPDGTDPGGEWRELSFTFEVQPEDG
ncbi:maleylacetate reductase and hydroxyquinol 1,2-dioxygenase domain-containing protein [Pseudonocardia sp. HH130630-07]|uniref:maleylacetate reductase and hydroxyquinol 1,2-dioxygenase domain-containing protein n=1 Tax=Pseudonocardia sp. HH130630-07 TaxID=1690815 RepID=UPI0008152F3D|nr:maleylacetate reductase and hydroxyquinol 1,2-dioxygenase domain-containing protein [Pseudonocardia sp. HH130630-07]ANY08840.1 alcohol dehydrogenase [Pseudonocardia sp. HH130630-07]